MKMLREFQSVNRRFQTVNKKNDQVFESEKIK